MAAEDPKVPFEIKLSRLHHSNINYLADSEPITTFEGGAHRASADIPPWSDMPWDIMRDLADLVYREGREKYDKDHVTGTLFNWQKGLDSDDTFNHLLDHLARYRAGDRSEPHLLKAAWGCLTQSWYDKHEPDR